MRNVNNQLCNQFKKYGNPAQNVDIKEVLKARSTTLGSSTMMLYKVLKKSTCYILYFQKALAIIRHYTFPLIYCYINPCKIFII